MNSVRLSFRNLLKLLKEVILSVRTIKESPTAVSFRAFLAAISGAGHNCPFVSTILITKNELQKYKKIQGKTTAGCLVLATSSWLLVFFNLIFSLNTLVAEKTIYTKNLITLFIK
jgi:hypothetical protein